MGIRLGLPAGPALDLSGMQAELAAAKAMAQQAVTDAATAAAKGDNARQMVLNRDPRLTAVETNTVTLTTQQATLEQLANTLGAAIPAADATHATMNARMATIENAATTLAGRVTALEGVNVASRLAALEAKGLTRQVKTVATTAALAIGASVDVTCTWDTPFPDANYTPVVDLDATGLMANTTGPAWKSQTATSVTVTVKALVAVAAGVKIRFVGLRWG